MWITVTYIPEGIAVVSMFFIANMICISKFRNILMYNYNTLCSWIVTCAYMTLVFPGFMLEIRRSHFQQPEFSYVHWKTEYVGVWPLRFCNDTDPVLSWANHSDQLSVTCSNRLLDGNYFGTIILVNILPLILGMKTTWAIALSFLNLTLLVSACIFIGTSPSVFAFPAAIQFASGLSASYFCHLSNLNAMEEFAILKVPKILGFFFHLDSD